MLRAAARLLLLLPPPLSPPLSPPSLAQNVVAKFDSDPTASSPALEAWFADLAASGAALVDGTRGIEAALAVKDEAALEQVTKAGALTARVARNVFVKAMEAVIEEDKAGVTNASLAEEVAGSLDNLKALGIKVDTENFDFMQPPVVQSGGDYGALLARAGARSSDAPFSADVVLFSQAIKYKAHAAFVGRTYLIDPSPTQLRAYDSLLAAHDALVAALRPGAALAAAHKAAVDVVLAADLPAEAKLSKTFGSGYGLRAADKALAITSKSAATVAAGQVFNVCLSISELVLRDAPRRAAGKVKTYTLLIANTVVVGADGATVVTDKLPADRAQVVYSLGDDEDEDEDEAEEEDEADEDGGGKKKKKKAAGGAGAAEPPARSTRLAARKAQTDEGLEKAAAREAHQAELFEARKKAALKALAKKQGGGDGEDEDDEGGGGDAAAVRNAPPIEAYSSVAELPRIGVRPCAVTVDKAHNAVLVPLFGSLVPFHVSTVKSAVKSEEGAKALLRLNFYAPGAAPGKECAAPMQAALLRHPAAIFVRTLTFSSKDHRNMANVVAMIKSMQKSVKVEREAAAQRAGLVEQPKLRLNTDAKFPRLTELNMWPAISGRKTQGSLEAHSNGLRFLSTKGERVEIIYANVRHAIFQPAEREHIVLLHFHLKHPIMIGKKKYKDVQFFTEVVEASLAIDGRQRDFHDDELGEEERERRMKQEMNKAFKKFALRVEEVVERDSLSSFRNFDEPDRDLAFPCVCRGCRCCRPRAPPPPPCPAPAPPPRPPATPAPLPRSGAPNREMVTLLPASDCLVSLVDKPPFVVSLSDVEHVHFERVTFTNKDFDIVFIYKEGVRDKGEDEFVRISSVPMRGNIDAIKAWLDDVASLTYTEGVANFEWKGILADVVRAPDFWLEETEDGESKPAGWGASLCWLLLLRCRRRAPRRLQRLSARPLLLRARATAPPLSARTCSPSRAAQTSCEKTLATARRRATRTRRARPTRRRRSPPRTTTTRTLTRT